MSLRRPTMDSYDYEEYDGEGWYDGPILYHFRDKARYRSKIEILSHLTCIRRPLLVVPVGILPYRYQCNNDLGVQLFRQRRNMVRHCVI